MPNPERARFKPSGRGISVVIRNLAALEGKTGRFGASGTEDVKIDAARTGCSPGQPQRIYRFCCRKREREGMRGLGGGVRAVAPQPGRGKDPPVTHTGVFGCSTKWAEKQADRVAFLRKLDSQPVDVSLVSAADLKSLRANPSRKMTLINFWATWCGACVDEFADLEDTYRMYSVRDLAYVTVSTNMPDEKPGVLRLLQHFHSTGRNLLFASDDTATLQVAFDPKWDSAVPYTVLLAADGTVLYQKIGSVDILELRRRILANLPSDYIGFNRYWSTP